MDQSALNTCGDISVTVAALDPGICSERAHPDDDVRGYDTRGWVFVSGSIGGLVGRPRGGGPERPSGPHPFSEFGLYQKCQSLSAMAWQEPSRRCVEAERLGF